MIFKEIRKKVKGQQKQLALQIRRGKYLRKPTNRKNITKTDRKLYYYGSTFDDFMVKRLSSEYRHFHIAYCTFFNNTEYGLIETPAESPDKGRIKSIKECWESELDETVRDSS